MSVKQVLQLESESVSCQPVSIPFEFTRLESLPEGKTVGESIAITPITVRTWFRIKPLLLYIDKEAVSYTHLGLLVRGTVNESCMPFPVDKDLKALMSFIRFV